MWKVWLIQAMTESMYFGNSSTMSTIWVASMDPSSTTKPTLLMSTTRKTRKVASPLRIPRAAIHPTAGSTARARRRRSGC